MQIFPPFTGMHLSEVEPGSIIISEARNVRSAISICGRRQNHQTAMYTVFPEGDKLSPEPHIGHWRCRENPFVANFGREYILVVEPISVVPVEEGDSTDLGAALCARENEKYIRIMATVQEGGRREAAYLNLETGESHRDLPPPYMACREWSIGFRDPAGGLEILFEAPTSIGPA